MNGYSRLLADLNVKQDKIAMNDFDRNDALRKLSYCTGRWDAITELMQQIQEECKEILKVLLDVIDMLSGIEREEVVLPFKR